ncbi:MAG TPA: GspH/FimT family pseudopilin [Ramlibacter sp.]|jgi:type IV fimbrial biogenesis protein FimT
MDPRTHRTQRGFNLLEVVVSLAILGTLLGAAVPDVVDMVQASRLSNVSNDVLQQLQLARSEAIKRNGRVALCKSADGEWCSETGGWEQGWILFQDANNSGAREATEPMLQRLLPIPAGYRLAANAPLARYVSYGPMGGARMTSNAFQAGTFTVCRISADPVEGHQIIVNASGRPRLHKLQLADCM